MELLSTYVSLQDAFAAVQRLETLDEQYDDDRHDTVRFARPESENLVKGVEAAIVLETGKVILEKSHFSIPANGLIVITGKSGSGKTSFINSLLFPGYSEISGVEKSQVFLDSSRIGYAPQNPVLVSGTWWENIVFGRDNLNETKVLNAANLAGIQASNVNDLMMNSKTASGGEKQRIQLARALVDDPKLVILDEPTANLDALTTSTVVENLVQISQSTCIVVITHEPQLVAAADILFEFREQKLNRLKNLA